MKELWGSRKNMDPEDCRIAVLQYLLAHQESEDAEIRNLASMRHIEDSFFLPTIRNSLKLLKDFGYITGLPYTDDESTIRYATLEITALGKAFLNRTKAAQKTEMDQNLLLKNKKECAIDLLAYLLAHRKPEDANKRNLASMEKVKKIKGHGTLATLKSCLIALEDSKCIAGLDTSSDSDFNWSTLEITAVGQELLRRIRKIQKIEQTQVIR